MNKQTDYFLAGGILIAAIIVATAWIYSAQIEARGGAVKAAETATIQTPLPSAPARSGGGGCGV